MIKKVDQKRQLKDQISPFKSKKWIYRIFYFFQPESCQNQFGHNNSDSDEKFGLKKWIKSQLDHDLSQNFALGQLDHLSLIFFNSQRI